MTDILIDLKQIEQEMERAMKVAFSDFPLHFVHDKHHHRCHIYVMTKDGDVLGGMIHITDKEWESDRIVSSRLLATRVAELLRHAMLSVKLHECVPITYETFRSIAEHGKTKKSTT